MVFPTFLKSVVKRGKRIVIDNEPKLRFDGIHRSPEALKTNPTRRLLLPKRRAGQDLTEAFAREAGDAGRVHSLSSRRVSSGANVRAAPWLFAYFLNLFTHLSSYPSLLLPQ